MTKINEIYRCNICGNIVEVVHGGEGELVCCQQPMELLIERQTDVGPEKHIPILEKTEEGINVKIGEDPHPMDEKHFIEWVEIIIDGESYIKFFEPGDKPETEFKLVIPEDSSVKVREYCNIHGLWHS